MLQGIWGNSDRPDRKRTGNVMYFLRQRLRILTAETACKYGSPSFLSTLLAEKCAVSSVRWIQLEGLGVHYSSRNLCGTDGSSALLGRVSSVR